MEIQNKNVIIYTRVSTTEQKDSGYSLQQQKDALSDYCAKYSAIVIKAYEEDYSAKDFDRPQFQAMLKFVKQKSVAIDYVLVYSWDRFSRNTLLSYEYIDKFEKMGIEINAISQPINFNDPSQRILLSIYIVTPDVDNRIRSDKTQSGIIGSLKEGRFCNRAPVGYINGKDDSNPLKPLIKPCPKNAELITNIFTDYSTGKYSQAELISIYKKKGLKLKRSQFSEMLSNVLYMGRVRIPEYKGTPSEIVRALHQPLVTEFVFIKVQQVKAGKTNFKLNSFSNKHDEFLPLRGFLKCPQCGNNLTGSPSMSRNKSHYYYYHCNKKSGCKENVSAKLVNEKLRELLQNIKPSNGVVKLFSTILIDQYKKSYSGRLNDIKNINLKRKEIETKLDNLTEKYVDEKIGDETYKRISTGYNLQLDDFKVQTEDLSEYHQDLDKFVEFGLDLICNVDILYEKASAPIKRKLLGSIFCEKLVFVKDQYRTAKFNAVITLIANNTKGLGILKKESGGSFSRTSASVPGAGVEPARFPTGV